MGAVYRVTKALCIVHVAMYTRKYLINSVLFVCMCVNVRCACVCVFVLVCVCKRERERCVSVLSVYAICVHNACL